MKYILLIKKTNKIKIHGHTENVYCRLELWKTLLFEIYSPWEGLTLEKSAFKLFKVANLRYELSR